MERHEILYEALKIVDKEYLVNREVMDAKELDKLKSLSYQLCQWYIHEKHIHYVQSLKDFLSAIDKESEVMSTDDDLAIEKFYEKEFVITFGDATVSIFNGAEVFNAISDIIMKEIHEYEEEQIDA